VRAAVALLWLAAFASAEETRAFVELTTEQHAVYVGQPIRLTLRIGYDAEYFERYAVQLFQQKLDVPVHVEAEGLTGPFLEVGGKTIALNDDVGYAAVSEPRDRYSVLVVEQTLLFAEPGERVFAAPSLRFASGTKFREDFLHGRVATDRRDTVVRGKVLVLRVLPIPTEGRPATWGGAVGHLTIRAEASKTELDEGGSLDLTLHIGGEGNAQAIPIPLLADLGLRDFHVLGSLSSIADSGRTITYSVRPLSAAIDAVPTLVLPYFDTSSRRFREAKSDPIPITVRAKPTGARDTPVPAREPDTFPFAAVIGAVIAVAVVLFLAARRRSQQAEETSAALKKFEARKDADLAYAFADYLAAHLGCARAAVISPDLKERLVNAGLEAKLSAVTARRMERLVAARYGGADPKDPTLQSADDLVRHLEMVFALLVKKDR